LLGGLFRPLNLLLIIIVVLIVLGPGKLPRIGRDLGRGLRGLKGVMSPDNRSRIRARTTLMKSVAKTVLKLYYTFFSKK
jgi:TatA/E family protein of Tat protein translocase